VVEVGGVVEVWASKMEVEVEVKVKDILTNLVLRG